MSQFCGSGIWTRSGLVMFLFHVAIAEVMRYHSVSGWASLEDPRCQWGWIEGWIQLRLEHLPWWLQGRLLKWRFRAWRAVFPQTRWKLHGLLGPSIRSHMMTLFIIFYWSVVTSPPRFEERDLVLKFRTSTAILSKNNSNPLIKVICTELWIYTFRIACFRTLNLRKRNSSDSFSEN